MSVPLWVVEGDFFYVDRVPVAADTFLCTCFADLSKGLRNGE